MLPEFHVFFKELWGYDPFPWQKRLAEELCTSGKWPGWITLPTGTGKTACIDIAIYHLATQAGLPIAQRSAPVRIVFAVNRRIVVDEAFERAKAIAAQLEDSLEDPQSDLHPVATALFDMARDEKTLPLEVYPLRGGTFTDHAWARTPTQPLVITTTLDQLGSRLLFRGYGVSEYARPLHAALLANDALLILDEAHTSKAFSQTLRAVSKFRTRATDVIETPFHSVQLTATPPAEAQEPFSLSEEDENNDTICSRISASKPTGLDEVTGAKGKQRHLKLAAKIVEKTGEFLQEEVRHTLVVVNRVATAESVLDKLTKAKGIDAEVRLLTGRIRPLDRDRLIEELDRWLKPAPGMPPPEKPLILVATQCIEVGADYDFDALLTELAPLDCLRQRFGRLNRTGREILAPGLILAPEEALDERKVDPIYGDCLPAVWRFLEGIADLDFGISGIEPHLPSGDELVSLLAPTEDAPVLLPTHLDLWCQTSPLPHAEPEPSLYIHGSQKNLPDVYALVRSYLGCDQSAPQAIEALPPIGAEAVTLPLHFARDLLSGSRDAIDDSGDVPRALEESKNEAGTIDGPAWIYREGAAAPVGNANELRSGDFLIVPAGSPIAMRITADGGDQYELGFLTARDKLRLRFNRVALRALEEKVEDADAKEDLTRLIAPLFETGESGELDYSEQCWLAPLPEIAALLAQHLPTDCGNKRLWEMVNELVDVPMWKVMPMPKAGEPGVIIESVGRAGFTKWPLEPYDLATTSTVAERRISLAEHQAGVSARACRNARGLQGGIEQALRDAGLWHDLGKLDPRFQALLYGVASYAIGDRKAIAKSGDGFRTKTAADFLRKQAGLPRGFRHELLSTLIVAESGAAGAHPEGELLLHLIASHHGRCRALAPVVPDDQPEPITSVLEGETVIFSGVDCPLAHMEQGVTRRFWSLTRRFGWWGLAYLESLLRLADQRESARPTPSDT